MQGKGSTVEAVPVTEIFSSVQGEGPYVGCRHLFIRFAGCNLSCAYCDTSRAVPGNCRVEVRPGTRRFVHLPNPLTPEEVGVLVSGMNPAGHHAVSLTGGEPLLYPGFLGELIPLLRGARRGIYLETNGTLDEALKRVVRLVDVVAMDVKLPTATGMRPFWEEHRRFLAAAQGKKVVVKAVVTRETPVEEVLAAAEMAQEAKAILVLQPVTARDPGRRPAPAQLLYLQSRALEVAKDVRVIPQVHRLCGML